MADNLGYTVGSGATIRSEDKTGLHSQVVIIDIGGSGAEALLTAGQALMAASIPVAIASDQTGIPISGTVAVTQSGTWNINSITGAISLPTGAATAANQLPNSHDVTIDNAAGASAVNIQDGGNSITVDGTVAVSGTVAVTQSGTWDEVGINDSGNSITIDNSTLSVVGGGLESSALRVTIANDSTGVLSVDDNGGSLTIDGTVSATQSGTWVLGANSGVDVGDVTINNAGGGSAVNVQDGGNSLTVDGTVAATQSGTWNINNVSGTVSLPTGAATSANQSTEITSLQLLDDTIIADDAAFTPGTTKVNMCGFEFDDTAPDSVNEGDAGAARMSANRNIYIQLRDNAGNERGLNIDANARAGVVAVGQDAVGAAPTANPVYTGFRQLISGTVTSPDVYTTGGINYLICLTPDPQLHFEDYSVIGESYGFIASTDGTKTNTRYILVDANNNVQIVGSIAHDTADSGNPMKIGGRATSGNVLQAAVSASSDRVDAFFDERGRLQTRNIVAATPITIVATASGNTTVLTPTAGKAVRVKFIHLVNNTATVVDAGLRFAAAGTIRFAGDLAADGGARLMNLINSYWEGAVDEALIVNLSAGGSVSVTVMYEEF